MAAFKAGDIDLLVATTVIEVGVDVPNASLMIIENPERLGLAQLHQLRGRVGRGSEASSCVLLYQPPLTETARARLAVLRETGDGFEIARRDMELRGPGEVLGTRQTGEMQFHIADLLRDEGLLAAVEQRPDLPNGRFGFLQEDVIRRALAHSRRHDWEETVPERRIRSAQLTGWIGLALLAVVCGGLATYAGRRDTTADAQTGPGASLERTGYEVTVAPGDTVTFTITVTNEGNVDAANVEVTDFAPADLTNPTGAGWNTSGADPVYTIAALAAGDSTSFDITFTVDAGFTGTLLTNDAEITLDDGDDIDSTPADGAGEDFDSADIAVERYDLALLDHNMPVISGIELAARINRLQPDRPIILFTGMNIELLRRDAELSLVESRHHDPQPGAPALAPRHQHIIRQLQLAVFLAAAQPAVDFDAPLLRQYETRQQDQLPRDGRPDIVHAAVPVFLVNLPDTAA